MDTHDPSPTCSTKHCSSTSCQERSIQPSEREPNHNCRGARTGSHKWLIAKQVSRTTHQTFWVETLQKQLAVLCGTGCSEQPQGRLRAKPVHQSAGDGQIEVLQVGLALAGLEACDYKHPVPAAGSQGREQRNWSKSLQVFMDEYAQRGAAPECR